ncbi:MAG: spermidine/putrescine ABC transporter substrate-binding protein [Clostridiales bacterium]|jgi:spermidine/putrescine-binding protein|nr:spermidine/putrescine ABC transporter substrate-binding protein [Clostridiales bacterium]
MKKIMVAAILAALVLMPGCAKKEEAKPALSLYTWEAMFPQEVLDAFTEETGYPITYSNFDFDETMLAKLEASNGGDYDLVIADDYIIEEAVNLGLVSQLDKSKLSNYGNINPVYQKPFYDPEDLYTVPYGAGVQTILYNPDKVLLDINGYKDLWDSTLRDDIGVIANYRVVNGLALKVLGESYNTDDLDVIQQAGDRLVELAPNIRLIKDDNLQDDILSGEVAAIVGYTSMVTMALIENPNLKVVFPEEGIGFGIMAAFIPSKAPNSEAAYAFLDYIMDPERGAECFEYLGYYSTYKASDPFISDEYKSFLTLPEGFATNMEMIQNISAEANEKHEQIWTLFKNAAGQ